MMAVRVTVLITLIMLGSVMLANTWPLPAPSMTAASIRSWGTV